MTEIINLYYPPSRKAVELYERRAERHEVHLVSHEPLEGVKNLELVKDRELAKRNAHICEWTAILHAYESISPQKSPEERIVFSHYRKFMDDPSRFVLKPFPHRMHTVETWTKTCHPVQTWIALMDEVLAGNPGWHEERMFFEWANLHELPAPCCLFSLPNALFREMVEWVAPKVLDADRRLPYVLDSYKTQYQQRGPAFIGERLFSYWAWSRHRELLEGASDMLFLEDSGKPFDDMEERRIQI